jgi:hypothetical protein
MSFTETFRRVISRGARSPRLPATSRNLSSCSQEPVARVPQYWQGSCRLAVPPIFPDKIQVRTARYHSTSVPTVNTIAATPTATEPTDPAEITETTEALKRLAKSKSTDIPQKADELLQRLDDRNITGTFELFFWAIECWSRTKRKGSEERIEELYHQLLQSFQREMVEDDAAVALTTTQREENSVQLQETIIRVLKAYHHVSNAHRAEDLLLQFADNYRSDRLVPPTLEMCKSVLSTWSRSDSSRRALRAEKLLSIMGKDPALPDPDITCYTSVLNCWASSKKENAPRRAELLLRSMELTEDEVMRPNMLSYSCVLNAWARSLDPDAPDQAERLLHEMEQTKGWEIDRVVYTAMISVWGRSPRPKSIDKAEAYFERLQSLQTQSSSTPENEEEEMPPVPKATVVEYTALMQGWAYYVANNINESKRAVDRVEELLEELMDIYFTRKSEGDADAESVRPNKMTFASVFRTIGAARRIPNRGDRANRALGEMQKLNLEPTTYILNLIEKCARGPSKKKPKRNMR